MLKKCKKDDKEGVYEVWIEEDYFSFAVAMERESVRD
jgi:hypothetical protein